jgi:hypothetical protein
MKGRLPKGGLPHFRANLGLPISEMWDFVDLLPNGINGWIPKYDYQ